MSKLLQATRRTRQAYETHSAVYVKAWNRRRLRIPDHLEVWRQGLPSRGSTLDLGCGLGQDSRYLQRKHYRVVGLDVTWTFLRIARTRSLHLPVIQADMVHLPFAAGSFDGVWAAASLIHIPKIHSLRVFRELRAVTKPGGLLGATMAHGKGSGFLADQWIRGRFLSRWHKPELTRLLEKAGWEVISVKVVANQERKGRWLNLLARRPVF